jgi:hypothetical protein
MFPIICDCTLSRPTKCLGDNRWLEASKSERQRRTTCQAQHRDRDRGARRDRRHRIFHGLLLQHLDPALGLVADVVGDFRFDVLRRNLVADVFGGIGYPLPN